MKRKKKRISSEIFIIKEKKNGRNLHNYIKIHKTFKIKFVTTDLHRGRKERRRGKTLF